MSASSSSNDATASKSTGTGNGCPAGGGSQGPTKKTNVCLICGIYTNLSLNIFEPRNGPDIREVIFQKYNFRAERGDNEDKYICYSCNNWLINWYSLQHMSETRNYESTPSSSRSPHSHSSSSSSENRHNKRAKNADTSGGGSSSRSNHFDQENQVQQKQSQDQDDQVSSTVRTPPKKARSDQRRILQELNGHIPQETEATTTISSSLKGSLVNSQRERRRRGARTGERFETRLIRMLENQGTSVYKENIPLGMDASGGADGESRRKLVSSGKRCTVAETNFNSENTFATTNGNEILLSFDSAITEVVNVVPALRSLKESTNLLGSVENTVQQQHPPQQSGVELLKSRRMSRSLSISLIEAPGKVITIAKGGLLSSSSPLLPFQSH